MFMEFDVNAEDLFYQLAEKLSYEELLKGIEIIENSCADADFTGAIFVMTAKVLKDVGSNEGDEDYLPQNILKEAGLL